MGNYTCSHVLYYLLAGVSLIALVPGSAEGLGDKYLIGTGKRDLLPPLPLVPNRSRWMYDEKPFP